MKTYQDFMEVMSNDSAKGKFCRTAVDEFRASTEYAQALDGERYYAKHNTTIEKFQKMLYTVSGAQVPDIFSADYRLKTLFFRRLVIQQTQYLLGNGAVFKKSDTKNKLGKKFDNRLQKAAKKAMAGGRAFAFWNMDHVEVFGYADTKNDAGFCPLYDEETGELGAGIRFWFREVGDVIVCRMTLYEVDGVTEYKQQNEGDVLVHKDKTAYVTRRTKTAIGGVESEEGMNYTKLPIFTLYANDTHESELVGIKESIDCYDFIKSGLANDIDDTSGFYWILKNTGGMDDASLAEFIQRMKTVKAQVVDGNQGVEVESHTLDIPTQARDRMLEILRADIYEDFQALDVKSLSAANKTTQEIQAAYQSQDDKCDDFEYCIIEFIQQLLEFLGIDDEPTFVRNKVINQAEQTNMVLAAANYLTEELVIKHLPFLTPEEAEAAIKAYTLKAAEQFGDDEDEEDEE